MDYLTIPSDEKPPSDKRKASKLHAKKVKRNFAKEAKDILIKNLKSLHQILHDFTISQRFTSFILSVVVVNTGVIVSQTFDGVPVRYAWFFSAVDNAFLSVYMTECVLKLLVFGKLYFTNRWDNLDFLIVIMSLLDFTLPLVQSSVNFGKNASLIFRILKVFRGIRAIRAFRVLRTIRFLSSLQAIISTCLQSLQSMGAIIILIFTFLFMFAVIFRELFSKSDPERFGTIFNTIFTLFQILTLDDWSKIYLASRDNGGWYIIIFLITYIILEYFTFLNLFIAVLVDNFQLMMEERNKKKALKKDNRSQDDEELEFSESFAETENLKTVKEVDDETFLANIIEQHYGRAEFSFREKQLLFAHFQLLASVEHNLHIFRTQAATLDNIVDTFFEGFEEDIQGKEKD